MADARRKRPWWHWALGAFAGLLILSALFGADDEKPAKAAATTTTAGTSTTTTGASPQAPPPAATIARARAAADDGRYAAAVSLATDVGASARDAISDRIANRIARRAAAAVRSGDLGQARARLAQAGRFPTTALTRTARASYRTAKARVAARALRARQAAAQRRRDAATARAAKRRAAREQAASACDPSYAGACLNPSSADYDCEGGSGNGPDYTGTVQVVGDDHFDLDRDRDGTGCD